MAEVTPIGHVASPVKEAVDDVWGGVVSRIDLDPSRFPSACLDGLDGFSHVEVVFVFDRVDEAKVTTGARHPHGREDWPGWVSELMSGYWNSAGN
ncbi:MAG TPA: hypothetical protein VGM43_23920 [Bryobacteraceae bacterium]|jgi:tRNA (Thr-GGU) A37 N-methylase